MRVGTPCAPPSSRALAVTAPGRVHRRHHARGASVGDQVVSSALIVEKTAQQAEDPDTTVLISSARSGRGAELVHELTRNPYISIYDDFAEAGRVPGSTPRVRRQPSPTAAGAGPAAEVTPQGSAEPVRVPSFSPIPVASEGSCMAVGAPAQPAVVVQASVTDGVPPRAVPHKRSNAARAARPKQRQQRRQQHRAHQAAAQLASTLSELDALLARGSGGVVIPTPVTAAPAAATPTPTAARTASTAAPATGNGGDVPMELLRLIRQLPSLTAAEELWRTRHRAMAPNHVAAMWVRVSQLLTAAAKATAQGTVGVLTVPAPGAQGSTGAPVYSSPRAMQAAAMERQATELRAALRPSVLRLWDSLQDSTRFHAGASSVSEVTTMLRAHAAMQGVLARLQALHTRQTQQHGMSAQHGRVAGPGAVSGGPVRSQPGREAGPGEEDGSPTSPAPQSMYSSSTPRARSNGAVDSAPPPVGTPPASSPRQHGSRRHGAGRRGIRVMRWEAAACGTSLRHFRSLDSQMRRNTTFVSDMLQLVTPSLARATPAQLVGLLVCVVQLGAQPRPAWMSAWWAASLPALSRCTLQQLQSVCWCVGHLGVQPPPAWAAALYSATQPHLATASVRSLCIVAHGAAALHTRPPASWVNGLIHACAGRFEVLDAPAYALLLHALGRLGSRPPPGWLQEFWDSSGSLLDDFSVQEMCLLMKGAGYLGVPPEPQWQEALWEHTGPQLATGTTEQLAVLGWAVLVRLRLRPPPRWVHAWLGAMRKRCGPTTHVLTHATAALPPAPTGPPPLRPGPAMRAAAALAAVHVPDLPAWCARLRVPVPASALNPEGDADVSSTAAGLDPGYLQRGAQEDDSPGLGSPYTTPTAVGYPDMRRRGPLFPPSSAPLSAPPPSSSTVSAPPGGEAREPGTDDDEGSPGGAGVVAHTLLSVHVPAGL